MLLKHAQCATTKDEINVPIALSAFRDKFSVLGRVESFYACCQWALLSVQIPRLVTLPYYKIYCTEVH